MPTTIRAYERLLETFAPSEHLAQLAHGQEKVIRIEGANAGDAAIAVTHQAFTSYS